MVVSDWIDIVLFNDGFDIYGRWLPERCGTSALDSLGVLSSAVLSAAHDHRRSFASSSLVDIATRGAEQKIGGHPLSPVHTRRRHRRLQKHRKHHQNTISTIRTP